MFLCSSLALLPSRPPMNFNELHVNEAWWKQDPPPPPPPPTHPPSIPWLRESRLGVGEGFISGHVEDDLSRGPLGSNRDALIRGKKGNAGRLISPSC